MGDANQHAALEVRAHLARRRLKGRDLAAVLGVSLRTVSDLLGERRPWRVDELEAVALWFGLDLADLLPAKGGGGAHAEAAGSLLRGADGAVYDQTQRQESSQ